MLQASLSLPGIAGIVLTVGMAVDANILIFERIREELRNGMSPYAAINAGFEKAFSAIADSNVTTLIAGVVLFTFGTGPVPKAGVTVNVMVGRLAPARSGPGWVHVTVGRALTSTVQPAPEEPTYVKPGASTSVTVMALAGAGPAFETTPADGVLVVRGSDGVTRSFELTPARGPAAPVTPGDSRPLGFATALAFALLGGLILNLMPCVFPVLAIKALSLAGQGGVPTRLRAIQGLYYTAGVLVFLEATFLPLRTS